MRYKTAFRLGLKLVGVFAIVLNINVLVSIVEVARLVPENGLRVLGMYQFDSVASSVLVLIAGLYLFFGGEWIVRLAIPSNRPYCPECGYPLPGATLAGICPECGAEFVRAARKVRDELWQRWQLLYRRLAPKSTAGAALAAFTQLEAEYAQAPTRAYHTLGHVADCLDRLDRFRRLADRPAEVELAIWLHDAVYVPGAADNERRSADLARKLCHDLGVDNVVADSVEQLILATRHDPAPASGDDAALIMDIDLAGLASPPDRYDEYCRAVRLEFAGVSDEDFRVGRTAFLRGMLARPQIFRLPAIRSEFEASARANLTRELSALERQA